MDDYAVEKIKKQFDFSKDEDVLTLYAMIQSGQIRLDGPRGRELDDEIYELAMAARKRQKLSRYDAEKKADKTRKKKTDSQKPQKKQNKQNKRRRKVVVLTRKELYMRRGLTLFFVLTALLCFMYFGSYCYDAYRIRVENEKRAALKENEMVNSMYQDREIRIEDEESGQTLVLSVLEEYKGLYHQNNNLIGWLKIADINNDNADCVIDLPVLQTSPQNPTFYLDHNFDLEEDKNGALFLDASCDVLKPSTNLIIYGHNMRSGKMFGSLTKYKNKKFFDSHPVIQFDTIYEKGQYQVMYVFQSHIYSENEIAFKYYQFIDAASEKEFTSNMETMAGMSLYETGVTAVYGDQLLTLSTCDYEEKDGRFVVVAKRIL